MSDLLTGLNSRHELHMELPLLAAKATAARPLSLLLLEIRDLALWQRQVTPLAADRLIQTAGQTIGRFAPADACVCRWDYGSFALLLPDCPPWCAEDIGEALRVEAQQARLPAIFAGQGLALDFVYGVATLPGGDQSLLVANAQMQLESGRGGVRARLQPEGERERVDLQAQEAYLRLAESYLLHGDAYLRRHGSMTAGYAQDVARRLGFSGPQLAELRLAAAFADIAMKEAAGTAQDKPGCLTYGEYRRMARHPVFAADLCRTLGLAHGVIDTVLAHHEHWDGSGYPEGLSGSQIPLAAAILGACGAYASLLLPRPYRPARKPYAARATIAEEANKKWPASVVREVLTL